MKKKFKHNNLQTAAALIGGAVSLVAVSQIVQADNEVGDVRVYVNHSSLDDQIERAKANGILSTQDADVKVTPKGSKEINEAISTAQKSYTSQADDFKAKIDKYISDLAKWKSSYSELTNSKNLVAQFNTSNSNLINQLTTEGISVATTSNSVPFSQATGSAAVNTWLTKQNANVAGDVTAARAADTAQDTLESNLQTATNKFNVEIQQFGNVIFKNTGTLDATTNNISTYYDGIIAKAKTANDDFTKNINNYNTWNTNWNVGKNNVQQTKNVVLQTLESSAYLGKTVSSASLDEVKQEAKDYISNNSGLSITTAKIDAQNTKDAIVELLASKTLILGTILPTENYSNSSNADIFNDYMRFKTYEKEIVTEFEKLYGSALPATLTSVQVTSLINAYNSKNNKTINNLSGLINSIVSDNGSLANTITLITGPVAPTKPVIEYKSLIHKHVPVTVTIPTYTFDETAWLASYNATKPVKPTLSYHYYDIQSQPENESTGTNRDKSPAYGNAGTENDPYTALVNQTIGVKLTNDDIPKYRGGEVLNGTSSNDMKVFHSYVMEIIVPSNVTVDLALTKTRALADGFNVSFDETTHVLRFTATSTLLTQINLNKEVDYVVPTPIAYLILNDDDTTYSFNFKTTINNEYQTTSNTSYFKTSSADPTKHNYNQDTAVNIDGSKLLPNDVNEYHITWDLDQYKGSNVDSLMKSKGLYYIDDYPEGALEVKTPRFVDSNGKPVKGISYTIYDSLEDAPEDVQEYIKNSKFVIDGKFILYSVDDVESFNANYIQKGITVTIIQPMVTLKDPSVSGGSYKNVAFQIDFGNVYQSNTVTNTVPKIDPEKDVVARVGDLTSLAGNEIQLNQVFDYRLEGSKLPKNLAYGVKSYEFYDVINPKYDQYDGIYLIEATTDIALKNGRVIKAGSDITKYTTQELKRTNNKDGLQIIYIYVDPEFLDSIDWSKSEFGLDAFVQVKRVGASENILNEYKNIIQGVEYLSNSVSTNTYDYGVANLVHYVDENGTPLLASISGSSKVTPNIPDILNAALVSGPKLDEHGDWVITYHSQTSSDILDKFDRLDEVDKNLETKIDAETKAREEADRLEAEARAKADKEESEAREKALADEQKAREKADRAESDARAKANEDLQVKIDNILKTNLDYVRVMSDKDFKSKGFKAPVNKVLGKPIYDEKTKLWSIPVYVKTGEVVDILKQLQDATNSNKSDTLTDNTKDTDNSTQSKIDHILKTNLDYVRVMSDKDFKSKGFKAPANKVLGTPTYDEKTKLWSIPVYVKTDEVVDILKQLQDATNSNKSDTLTDNTKDTDNSTQSKIDNVLKKSFDYVRVMTKENFEKSGFKAPIGKILGKAVYDEKTIQYTIPVYNQTDELNKLIDSSKGDAALSANELLSYIQENKVLAVDNSKKLDTNSDDIEKFETCTIGSGNVVPVIVAYPGYQATSIIYDNLRGGWIITYKKVVKKP